MQEIQILWSTQSGRSKACARRAARILSESACHVKIDQSGFAEVRILPSSSFDQYGASNFLSLCSNPLKDPPWLVLFVSTTGDAEHCDSIRETWTALLRKSLPANHFAKLKFALFCLGDRAYGPDAFCAAGRKLAVRLVQLGAAPLCTVGYGDDGTPNGGVFCDLDSWLIASLLPCFHVASGSISVLRDPLYKVLLESAEKSIFVDAPELEILESSHLEEWVCDQYYDSYQHFFATLSPPNAYNYNDDQTQTAHIPPLVGEVRSNNRITNADWYQDTRHISIHIDNVTASKHDVPMSPYRAGDIATILPSNSDHNVNKFLSVLPKAILKYADINMSIEVTSTERHTVPWPKTATLRGILKYCADISSLPEREDLRLLSRHCNPLHPEGLEQREKLISLSEISGSALYGDYIIRERRTWADVLYDFDSIRLDKYTDKNESASLFTPLTIEYLLGILPPIHPRHFSIASSPLSLSLGAQISHNAGRSSSSCFDVEICVAVVAGKTPRGRSYQGLCSSYLSKLVPSSTSKVLLWLRPGSFHGLPLRPRNENDAHVISFFQKPIVCIGSGTGIAPLRALIHERETFRKISTLDKSVIVPSDQLIDGDKDNILIFGCRKLLSDCYYLNEWDELVKSGALRLLTAFSQEYDHKVYVQRILRELDNGDFIASHVLERKGAVYIAGNAKMARAVKEELVESLGRRLPGGAAESKRLIRKMQIDGLFAVEAWS